MNKLFHYILAVSLIVVAPRAFAQTTTNSDFNPFPQMEQDMNSTDDQAPAAQQQNDDWPPPNEGAQANAEGSHD
jgi:hypothetical protein